MDKSIYYFSQGKQKFRAQLDICAVQIDIMNYEKKYEFYCYERVIEIGETFPGTTEVKKRIIALTIEKEKQYD